MAIHCAKHIINIIIIIIIIIITAIGLSPGGGGYYYYYYYYYYWLIVSSNLTCPELTHTANTKAITGITIMHKCLLKFGSASFMETV